VTFEEWYEKTVGVSLEQARRAGTYDLHLMQECWKASRATCAKECREIGMKHHEVETTYAAGKKAGAFECAEKFES
jgi:hypothetical protein